MTVGYFAISTCDLFAEYVTDRQKNAIKAIKITQNMALLYNLISTLRTSVRKKIKPLWYCLI